MLVPALARHCVYAGHDDDAAAARRNFRGASTIAVGSVDFSPYIRLLLTPVDGVRLADVVVVITDGDPELPAEDTPVPNASGDEVGDSRAAYNRADDLAALGTELSAGDALYIAEAPHTLEADLLVEGSSNREVLEKAYLAQHPKSTARWKAIAGSGDAADALYTALRKTKRLLAKGQFAHDIAEQINGGAPFTCPEYLATAIKRVVEGPPA